MRLAELKNDRSAWLNGPARTCSHPPQSRSRPWRLVLLGAPGVGKGTQAELIAARLGTCHLSTGDVFRAAKSMADQDRSSAMSDALGYMKRGELVPDATVLAMVRERTKCLCCGSGFLLDGFPRTVAQAEALQVLLKENNVHIDAVLDYRLPLDEIVLRLSGRRTCETCKAVYHVTARPPQRDGICDQCRGKLLQREDDLPEAINIRMAAYTEQTSPLTNFYEKWGILIAIDARGTPDEIFDRTLKALQR